MATLLNETERAYRVVDGIYRLHRDLFEIEHLLGRSAALQLRLVRMNVTGWMGTLVAGLLAIVPILISLGHIEWGSTPAVFIYVLAGGVVLLWIWQVVSAKRVEQELATLEPNLAIDELTDRSDFLQEEVNAWAVRHRMVQGILGELGPAAQPVTQDAIAATIEDKRIRYTEVLQSCEQQVEYLLERSKKLVKEGRRTSEDHAELLDWAAAIPKFAPKRPTSA